MRVLLPIPLALGALLAPVAASAATPCQSASDRFACLSDASRTGLIIDITDAGVTIEDYERDLRIEVTGSTLSLDQLDETSFRVVATDASLQVLDARHGTKLTHASASMTVNGVTAMDFGLDTYFTAGPGSTGSVMTSDFGLDTYFIDDTVHDVSVAVRSRSVDVDFAGPGVTWRAGSRLTARKQLAGGGSDVELAPRTGVVVDDDGSAAVIGGKVDSVLHGMSLESYVHGIRATATADMLGGQEGEDVIDDVPVLRYLDLADDSGPKPRLRYLIKSGALTAL